MRFIKYDKLKNTTGNAAVKFKEAVVRHGLYKGTWYVSEKVHGSNFSIIYNGEEYRCGKRSGWVGSKENFYNFEQVLEDNKECVHNIYEQCLELYPSLKFVTVFGELFGGLYPHKDVPENSNAKIVQKGVYYSPDNMFYAFDIVVSEDKNNPNKSHTLSVPKATEIFEKSGIFHAKILFKGTLDECVTYPNAFNSLLPEWLDLPPLEGENICEGTVIRPEAFAELPSRERVIFKNKNSLWGEQKQKASEKNKEVKEISEREILDCWASYLTENRLSNVMSKFSEDEQNNFGMMLGCFKKDAYEDFKENDTELELEFREFSKSRKKLIERIVGTDAAIIVRKRLFG